MDEVRGQRAAAAGRARRPEAGGPEERTADAGGESGGHVRRRAELPVAAATNVTRATGERTGESGRIELVCIAHAGRREVATLAVDHERDVHGLAGEDPAAHDATTCVGTRSDRLGDRAPDDVRRGHLRERLPPLLGCGHIEVEEPVDEAARRRPPARGGNPAAPADSAPAGLGHLREVAPPRAHGPSAPSHDA